MKGFLGPLLNIKSSCLFMFMCAAISAFFYSDSLTILGICCSINSKVTGLKCSVHSIWLNLAVGTLEVEEEERVVEMQLLSKQVLISLMLFCVVCKLELNARHKPTNQITPNKYRSTTYNGAIRSRLTDKP
jgi:hypothetical protein